MPIPRPPYPVIFGLLFARLLFAQSATLRGQITDESGAVIPGARVTLHGPSGTVKSTVADNNGTYSFAALVPGDYTVRASATELSLAQPAMVTLEAGSHSLNLVLRVASISEKLTVQDTSAPALTTDSSDNAGAVVLRGADLDALSDDPGRPGGRPAGAGGTFRRTQRRGDLRRRFQRRSTAAQGIDPRDPHQPESRSRRSTTNSVTARSKSSPSQAPTSIAGRRSGTSPTISGTRATLTPRQGAISAE